MAIDVNQLVLDQLEPVLTLDSTITTAVVRAIEAQTALYGFGSTPSDEEKVLLALYTLRSLIPRLSLKFALKIKDVKSVKAEAKFDRAMQYLDLLAEQIQDQIEDAQEQATPEDVSGAGMAWPGIGPIEWRGPDD